ncbi:hypothetical protein VNI00_014766 [Paramarasmius palmivorus]|uniref:Transmembrane protein n=1 Tax=Paramarasmius palmivorus TaxID=297713 RepID=A0AAW0BQH4_9AGAR
MSDSQQVTLIMNVDNSTALLARAQLWQYLEDPVWYGGSAAFIDASQFSPSQSSRPVFDTSFHGTSIALYGYVLESTVELDTTIRANGSSQAAMDWYQSPLLSDQEHTIIAQFGDITIIDYALIQAGTTTDLSGKTIFVDDTNKDELWFTGQWHVSENERYSYRSPNSIPGFPTLYYPANRTVTLSSASGDSFEFRFSGTSISVYGVYIASASYTVDFIMDDSVQRVNYTQDNKNKEWMINYKLYENTTLTPENHILVVNVTSTSGAYFYLDYITYTPSFNSIHEKPTFIRAPPVASGVPPGRSLGLPVEAIVGIIVIAGLSMVTFAGIFWWFWKKRSALRKDAKISAQSVEPFASHLAVGSKSRPTKWMHLFPSERTPNPIASSGEESSHLAPLDIHQDMTEVQRRNDEIASLTAEIQHSDHPSREELLARISMLTMEVERLVRENAPPEYGGSDSGQRETLPSYDARDGA